MNARTVKLPRLTLSGYKDHSRTTMGFNTGTASLDWEPKVLSFDRDIEFAIDPMDIDETNLALAVANIQNTFEEEQAIPERDAYAFSKLYADYVDSTVGGGTASTDSITAANILEKFDADMAAMDDAGVPEEGRILYATPAWMKLLKEAEGIERAIMISGPAGTVNRNACFFLFQRLPEDVAGATDQPTACGSRFQMTLPCRGPLECLYYITQIR